MNGFYAMYRGWLEHETWGGDRFDKRSAFCWLIENARFSPGQVTVGDLRVDLDRGQLAVSIRYLAQAWQWDTKTVQRFLRALTSRKMVTTATPTGVTVITVCNYERFQNVGESSPTPTPTPIPTPAPTNKNKEDNKVPYGAGAPGLFPETKAEKPKSSSVDAVLFGACLEFIKLTSEPDDKKARSLIGKWRKDARDDHLVASVVLDAQARNISEPVAWIFQAIAERKASSPQQRRHTTRNPWVA